MKVTTKGQVTIPAELRDKLGIHPGAEVDFAIEGKSLKITPVKNGPTPGEALVRRLRGTGTVKMTTDEIMALTRGED